MSRCAGFVLAVGIYRKIVKRNPVYGDSPKEAEKFEWASKLKLSPPDPQGWTELYMDAFGAVTVPTVLPNKRFYQRDRTICEPLLASP